MPAMNIDLKGDNAWADLRARREDIVDLTESAWGVTVLDGGMASGKPSVALRLDMPDGKVVFAQTSLELWIGATIAFRAKYPDTFAGTPLADRQEG